MAKWQIDRWKVKPSGFLASWRERALFVDEGGIVTSECVPGKECMNLSCISDYDKNDRKYRVGDLITTYCNIITHSRWSIYAQDCAPFANAVEELDVVACGYNAPLPAPSVPFNPFGTVPYGLYAYYDYCDKNNVQGQVRFFKKNFAGTAIQIESGGPAPVVLSYKDSSNKFEPIMSLEAVFTFIASDNFQYSYLFTGDEREIKSEVEYDGGIIFKGFVTPDSNQEPFSEPEYPVIVRANDGLGALQRLTYPMPTANSTDIRQRWIDILAYALSLTNLYLNIRTAVNVYATGMPNGIDNDPLALSNVSPLRFTDGSSIDTAYDVLVKLCNQFTATIEQVNGEWLFIRKPELTEDFIRTRLYLNTGFFLRGEEIRNLKTAGVRNTDFIQEATPYLTTGNAYKRAVVQLDYGVTSAVIHNGGFGNWDGMNFPFWTRFGGISLARFQKQIPGSGGASIPVDDYAALFLQPFAPSRYIQSSPIEVFAGNEIKMNFDVGFTGGQSILRFRIKVGQWYLVDEIDERATEPIPGSGGRRVPSGLSVKPSDVKYKWVTADSAQYTNPYTGVTTNEKTYARVYVSTGTAAKNSLKTFQLSMPAVPTTDQMYIQIFGFQPQRVTYPSGGIPIDNIKLSVTKVGDETAQLGLLYVSEQLGFYTQTPDVVPIVFGEYNDASKPRPARVQGGVKTDLYAIYNNGGDYIDGWKGYGELGGYNPIGLVAARTIIKNYQAKYYFYTGTLSGNDFSHFNVFRIVVECDGVFTAKIFMQMGVSYDIVNNTIDGRLVEIFSRPLFTNDGIIDNYPDTNLPPFVQNPTQPPRVPSGKIFTRPPFTKEFV